MQNELSFLVAEYIEKTHLKKLGYVFNGDNLTQIDYEVTMFISSQMNKLERDELKKKK